MKNASGICDGNSKADNAANKLEVVKMLRVDT